MTYPDDPYRSDREPDQEQRCKLHEELDALEASWIDNRAALARLHAAVEWIAERCRDGELASFARAEAGGPLWPLRPTDWFVDDPVSKFVREGGFVSAAGIPRISGAAGRNYIFVARDQLTSAIEKLPVPPKRAPWLWVVQWCSDWQAKKAGGMNRAWEVFKDLPERKGYTREDLRAAWEEARSLPKSL